MKKIIIIMIAFLCSFSLVACNGAKVESISVVNNSVSTEITTENVEELLLQIKIEVVYSDDKKEVINLSKEMISDDDYQKVLSSGTHQITIKYSNKSTTLTLVVNEPVNNNYTAVVQYPDGNPATGVCVQWCSSTNCFLPIAVNSNGFAEIELEDGTYYIHLENIPAGYTYDPNAYTTTVDNKHLVITLIPLLSLTSEDGSRSNPYVVGLGTYSLTFSDKGVANAQYFAYTATSNKTVVITSTAMELLAPNKIDPYLGFIGETDDLPNFNLANADASGNTSSEINFNYSFDVEEGKTYYFLVFVSSATSFNAEFNICLK